MSNAQEMTTAQASMLDTIKILGNYDSHAMNALGNVVVYADNDRKFYSIIKKGGSLHGPFAKR